MYTFLNFSIFQQVFQVCPSKSHYAANVFFLVFFLSESSVKSMFSSCCGCFCCFCFFILFLFLLDCFFLNLFCLFPFFLNQDFSGHSKSRNYARTIIVRNNNNQNSIDIWQYLADRAACIIDVLYCQNHAVCKATNELGIYCTLWRHIETRYLHWMAI